MNRTRAFTIVEILVAIGIMAIILGLAFPALMGARAKGGQVVSLANARTCAADIIAYADVKNEYPFITLGMHLGPNATGGTPDTFSIPMWPEDSSMGGTNIWWLNRWWPGLVSQIAPWEEHYESWISPGSEKTLEHNDSRVSYEYSNSFQARPVLWSTPTYTGTFDEAIKPVRPHEVVFPSLKALVWDAELAYINPRPESRMGHLDAPTPIGFPDGHAAIHRPQDATPGVPNPLNSYNNDIPLHNTPDGVKGRDY
jgi:type II secretory pathway pseudopilin PulG